MSTNWSTQSKRLIKSKRQRINSTLDRTINIWINERFKLIKHISNWRGDNKNNGHEQEGITEDLQSVAIIKAIGNCTWRISQCNGPPRIT